MYSKVRCGDPKCECATDPKFISAEQADKEYEDLVAEIEEGRKLAEAHCHRCWKPWSEHGLKGCE